MLFENEDSIVDEFKAWCDHTNAPAIESVER